MEYNTQRNLITLKEYGRNIHTMVHNLMNVEDKESRNQQAKNLVELMKQFVQPGVKENNDLTHKVWDDLYIISDFKLDVDCPYPIPDASVITKRPQPLAYSYSNPIFRHYGKNIELLVKKIAEIEDPEEKDNATIYVGRLMKTFYAQYSKDVIEDVVIKEQLEKLSGGKVTVDLERIKSENLFEAAVSRPERRIPMNTSPERRDRDNNNNNNRRKNGKNNLRRRK